MAQQRYYASAAQPATLTSALGSSGNPQVSSVTGWPTSFPFSVLLDWGLPTQEVISVTSAPTGTGPFTLPCTRGIDGTTAQSHVLGAIAVHGVSAQDFTQWSSFIDSLTGTAASNFSGLLTRTATKTAAYTASPGDYVACDTTTAWNSPSAGMSTVTLPAAPADRTVIGVKLVASAAPANAVTIAASGSDVFNKTAGATTETLATIDQGMYFQYQASTGIWMIYSADLALGQLDSRYTKVFNVKAYGAKGDNTANDTTAIQNALTAAGTIGTGATVYVPYTPAGYLCGTLVIPPGVTFLFDANAKLVAPSSLAAGWITLTPSVVHTGTKILNGTFDATAVTSASCFAVIECNGYTSCPDLLIDGNRVINAPKHGIFVGGEATYTLDKKWVTRNVIDEHGVVGVGFGIYADFSANVEISSNYVYTAGVDDSIELGHSGPHWLTGGINGHLTCDRNVVVGGQIQFPFSDYARITNNIVINNGIQNDTNTANYVTITGNTVFNSTPNSGYAGINVTGDYFLVAGNRVQVSTLSGIHSASTNGSKIIDNDIESLSAVGNSGAGVAIDAGTNALIRGNTIWGANAATSATSGGFHYGVGCGATNSLIAGNTLFATVGTSILDESTASGNVYEDNNCSAAFQPLPTLSGTGPVFRNNPGINSGAVSKTSAYTLKAYDFCVLANATSAGFTVTLPTAVGCAGQTFLVIKTDSSGNGVTLATTSSQTINGSTTQAISTQWATLYVVSDGANWEEISTGGVSLDGTATDIKAPGTQAAGSVGKAADAGHVHPGSTTTYTSTQSGIAVPAGATLLRVVVVGGGGGGGGSAGSSPTQIGAAGGAGGAGQYVEAFVSVSSANTYAVTVGAGGSAGAAGTINQGAGAGGGGNGNDSVFNYNSSATVITAKGGSRGSGGATGTSAGAAGGAYASPSQATTTGIWVPGQGGPGGASNGTGNQGGQGFGFAGTGGGGGGGANAGTANGTGGSAGTAAGGGLGGAGGAGGGGGTQAGTSAAANSGAGGGGAGGTMTVASTGAAGAAGGAGGSGFVIVQVIG